MSTGTETVTLDMVAGEVIAEHERNGVTREADEHFVRRGGGFFLIHSSTSQRCALPIRLASEVDVWLIA